MARKTPKEQQAEGQLDKMKGKAQEAWGALTNDNEDRLKGQADQLKGAAKEKIGQARDEARRKI